MMQKSIRLTLFFLFTLLCMQPVFSRGFVCEAEQSIYSDKELQESEEAWRAWKQRIEYSLREKIIIASTAFIGKSPSLHNEVVFYVPQDGKIRFFRMLRPSNSPFFNSLCVKAVESLEDSSILEYPKAINRGPVLMQLVFFYKDDKIVRKKACFKNPEKFKALFKLTPAEMNKSISKLN